MTEEQKNSLFDVDLNMFNEASEFLLKQQEEKTTEETTEEIEEEIDSNKVDTENQEDEEKIKDPSSQETKTDSSRLTPYFKLLVEEGLFESSDSEKWDGSTEGLINLQHEKINNWKEQYKAETLDPRVKWLQDNLEEGVPFEKLLEIDRQEVGLENITEEVLSENTDLQKTIAKQYYKETTRFSDDRINKEIQRLEDSGDLETESKTFSTELKDIVAQKKQLTLEQARQEREASIKEQEEVLKNFKETLNKTEELVPGMKITNVMKDKIYNTLTTVVEIDKNSGTPLNKIAKARMENPLEFEMKLAYLFELTDGFKQWDNLIKTGKKQAYKDFESAASNIDATQTSSKQNIPEYANDGDFLKELDKIYKKGLI